jgi:hypothetical protein
MFETTIISTLHFGFVVYERYFLRPKHIVFKPTNDNPFFAGAKNKANKIYKVGSAPEEFQFEDTSNRTERHKLLKELIQTVRSNKDNLLNLTLDHVMDWEMPRQKGHHDTEPS